MAIATSSITVTGVPQPQIAAMRERADRLGVSPEHYVRELIANDLELDALAARTSFAELAAPFEQALEGVSDAELDRLAKPARGKRRK